MLASLFKIFSFVVDDRSVLFDELIQKLRADNLGECNRWLPRDFRPEVDLLCFFKSFVACRALWLDDGLLANFNSKSIRPCEEISDKLLMKMSAANNLVIDFKLRHNRFTMDRFSSFPSRFPPDTRNVLSEYENDWGAFDELFALLNQKLPNALLNSVLLEMFLFTPKALGRFSTVFLSVFEFSEKRGDEVDISTLFSKTLPLFKGLESRSRSEAVPEFLRDYLDKYMADVICTMFDFEIYAASQSADYGKYKRSVMSLKRGLDVDGQYESMGVLPRRPEMRGFIRELLHIASKPFTGILECILAPVQFDKFKESLVKCFDRVEDFFMALLIVDDVVDQTGLKREADLFFDLLYQDSNPEKSGDVTLGSFSELYAYCLGLCKVFRTYFFSILPEQYVDDFDRDFRDVLKLLKDSNDRALNMEEALANGLTLEEYIQIPIVELAQVLMRYFVLAQLDSLAWDESFGCFQIAKAQFDQVSRVSDGFFCLAGNKVTWKRELLVGDFANAFVVLANEFESNFPAQLQDLLSMSEFSGVIFPFSLDEGSENMPNSIRDLIKIVDQVNKDVYAGYQFINDFLSKCESGVSKAFHSRLEAYLFFDSSKLGCPAGDDSFDTIRQPVDTLRLNIAKKLNLLKLMNAYFRLLRLDQTIDTYIGEQFRLISSGLNALVQTVREDNSQLSSLDKMVTDYETGWKKVYWLYVASSVQRKSGVF